MPIAYIGIGSNLGNRQENCDKAIALLTEKGINVLNRSSSYDTEPWGVKEQPKFINMAVETETDLTPEALLGALRQIEIEMGRQQTRRWGARIIDLDILFYNDLIMNTPELEIPHPGIRDRAFVLDPLCEIAPDRIHPVLRKSVKTLLSELEQSSPEKSGSPLRYDK
ncbi:MAG TPA: 2-amino-4-hydroxy-6-hydroxymethyldihydropteridine diphosphokinase [Nitrospirae bacterium]|nr:2-amino-4-hydroxy-6-hydroxymethyldihydropteridine diphosphokinase [Nitrospirota bacterium]